MFTALCAAVAVAALAGQVAGSAPAYADDKLNVHLICHTHDDVGWLKTVDQYFMGANNTIQHAGVQYILGSVIPALHANKDRKFIYVEQAFFQRWYREQDEATRNLTKELVAGGQLQFVNGGWCMHDEAATHYIAMIDQTTTGHTFLKSEFDVAPTVGWQIDPFGHSATNAALLSAEVGFNSLFFGRIDHQDHDLREQQRRLEFVWRASKSLGPAAQIFTGAFASGNYGPPSGFCFDMNCDDPPMQTDPNLEDVNTKRRVDEFVAAAVAQYNISAQTNHMAFKMGSDFQYENANEWFKNLDKLIAAVNADGRINVMYSSPDQYTEAVHATNYTWTVKTDDFFPYSDNPHGYWTGYFTSRPALKGYVRESVKFLQAARQIEVFAGRPNTTALEGFEEAVGVAQHHDAVSGTSKQHVAYDYARRLSEGGADAEKMTNDAMAAFITATGSTPPTLSQCRALNESICSVTQTGGSIAVLVYNPLPRDRAMNVLLPVNSTTVTVTGEDGVGVKVAVVTNTLPASPGAAPHSAAFVAHLPALGFKTFFLFADPAAEPAVDVAPVGPAGRLRADGSPTTVSNGIITLSYGADGKLASMYNAHSRVNITAAEDWLWYNSSSNGNNFGDTYTQDSQNQNSGAYVFRPNNTKAFPVAAGDVKLSVQSFPGVVTVVTQQWASWLVTETRLWAGSPAVDFEFSVGSIPIEDQLGKEIIHRYTTDIASNEMFYTDSNGRELQARKLNFRPTWTLNVTEPVSGNYYPINAVATLNSTKAQLSIVTDRSQGGASLASGEVEIMVHRRLLNDDHRGVGEPLNETQSITPYPNPVRIGRGLVIRATHTIFLDDPSSAAASYRTAMDEEYFSPRVFLSSYTGKWGHDTAGTWLANPLPANVALLTTRVWNSTTVLVRLGHQFAVDEDPTLSKPATVDLANLFASSSISHLEEMSLTANQPASAVKRLSWNTADEEAATVDRALSVSGTNVTLSAMEVRTFFVTLA